MKTKESLGLSMFLHSFGNETEYEFHLIATKKSRNNNEIYLHITKYVKLVEQCRFQKNPDCNYKEAGL